MGRRGDGGPDWGNIDWQNFDIRQLGGRGGRIARPPARRSIAVIVVLVLIFLIPIVFSPLVAFLTDLLWFRSLGLEDVYLRRYTAGFWAFIAFLLIFFVLAVPNLYFALRPQVPRVVVDAERPRGYALARYDLLFRQESVLTGAGYASINARLPALTVLAIIVAIAALACFANAFARTIWVLGGAIVVWFAASILFAGVYPGIVQNFIVKPDELNKERPFLERNINATRAAYRLDNVEESLFNVGDTPSAAEARRDLADTESIRLWDYRPLLSAFDPQALRQQYTFNDVDVDRYQIGGREVPVMLSARELTSSRLPQATWVNRHLVFTHGYGAVLTATGGVGAEGRPELLVKDIPPLGEPKIDQPRIYFGEQTSDYVIVDGVSEEFDYAQEGTDARTRYNGVGAGGVSVGTLWDRLLFSIRFGDSNLLFTNQTTDKSRVLFHRQIVERERLIAPFLSFDPDPYLVIADGGLWWINDAYTTGDRYPYSERYGALLSGSTSVGRGDFNYIRNSVKVVQNAYDGTIQFYVVDESDPVVKNLRAIYPALFKSIAQMPESLK